MRQYYNEYSMYKWESQLDFKRDQFRKSIRSRQVEFYFDTQRAKHAQWVIQEQKQQLQKMLSSSASRKQWVRQKVVELSSHPHKGWLPILKSLFISAKMFQQNFQDWIDQGLISKIVTLFWMRHRQLQLFHIAACVLEQLIFNMPSESPAIQAILSQGVIEDLIDLCRIPQSNAPYLINTILYKRISLRTVFVDKGLTQVLVQQLTFHEDVDSEQVYLLLSIAYRLIKNTNQQVQTSISQSNVILVLIPIFGRFLVNGKSRDILRVLLKALASVTKMCKEYILSGLFNCQYLVECLLHLLSSSDSALRSFSSNVLANISSSQNHKYCEVLMQDKILDKILQCFCYQSNHHQCKNNLLKIVSNLVSNSLKQAEVVFGHEVFPTLVMKYAHEANVENNHTDAIFIIGTLVEYDNFHILDILVTKYQIIQIFVKSLSSSGLSIENCLQVLTCLIKIVNKYQGRGSNKITNHLQSIYKISTVLEDVEQKMGSKTVQDCISLLLSTMYGS